MANSASGLTWEVPPEVLVEGIAQWGDRVVVALYAVGQYIAAQAQNQMRTGAVWTDRTGNARSALFSIAEKSGNDTVTIYLSHGTAIYYGVYLELAHGQRFAIIMPTMQRLIPEVKKLVQRVLS